MPDDGSPQRFNPDAASTDKTHPMPRTASLDRCFQRAAFLAFEMSLSPSGATYKAYANLQGPPEFFVPSYMFLPVLNKALSCWHLVRHFVPFDFANAGHGRCDWENDIHAVPYLSSTPKASVLSAATAISKITSIISFQYFRVAFPWP